MDIKQKRQALWVEMRGSVGARGPFVTWWWPQHPLCLSHPDGLGCNEDRPEVEIKGAWWSEDCMTDIQLRGHKPPATPAGERITPLVV